MLVGQVYSVTAHVARAQRGELQLRSSSPFHMATSPNGPDISMLLALTRGYFILTSSQWKAFNFIDLLPVKLPEESSALFGVSPRALPSKLPLI